MSQINEYDAIVVGAGNAGLSAALTLQKAGYKTLIVEKNNKPGGCAMSFMMGRFEIDPSIHELCSLGKTGSNGTFGKLLDNYGIYFDRIPLKDCFRAVSVFSDGSPMDVTMPVGQSAFIDAMEKYVPGSREGMTRLFDAMRQTELAVSENKGTSAKSVIRMATKYRDFLCTGAYDTISVFKAIGLNQKCIDILSSYWPYIGQDLNHLSFIHYSNMVYNYVTHGAYIPKHTCSDISMRAVDVFTADGGTVFYGCRAHSFITDGTSVTGVRTDAGDFRSEVVVANISPSKIYRNMVPGILVTDRQKKIIGFREDRFCGRPFTCYIGLDEPYWKLGIQDYCILISDTADSQKAYRQSCGSMDENNNLIFTCNNVAIPDFSPEGTCVCSLTTFCGSYDWERVGIGNYFLLKDSILEKCLDILEARTGIRLRGHIEEVCTASPVTFARYLGSPQGSSFGYECRDSDGIAARIMAGEKDYDIPGLYTCGSCGLYGDGYNATFNDGRAIGLMACSFIRGKKGENK